MSCECVVEGHEECSEIEGFRILKSVESERRGRNERWWIEFFRELLLVTFFGVVDEVCTGVSDSGVLRSVPLLVDCPEEWAVGCYCGRGFGLSCDCSKNCR